MKPRGLVLFAIGTSGQKGKVRVNSNLLVLLDNSKYRKCLQIIGNCDTINLFQDGAIKKKEHSLCKVRK